ncbi:ABC transporter permease [Dyadobacter subterraneus]|uniref:ABC transporter permease n=1 Tax=Dyadobacter subterraneus TaxID=2773304 RepID=A0ABR9W925_9BACT|nr:ABC transporter permease [Dyadobacter subterraneus]MBE9461981.1 ABC transporter permease [Dyadobacter subterraneus]
MKSKKSAPGPPPRFVTNFIKMLVAPHLREEILGDLQERYYRRMQQQGAAKAGRRYWLESLAYLRPAFIKRQKEAFPSTFLLDSAMFENYLKITYRTFFQNKLYSIINVAGLSIGLAAAMLIMLYTKDEISYDQFHEGVSQIYRVDRKIIKSEGIAANSGYTGYFQGSRFSAGVPEILAFVRLQQAQVEMKMGTEIQLQAVSLVDSNFLSVFTFPLISGNAKTALLDPGSVVITEDMAQKQFGTTDVLGRTIFLKDGKGFNPVTVTGVAKNCPQNSSIKFQVLRPLNVSASEESVNENWFRFFLNTFVVLAPNTNVQTLNAKMQKVFEADAAESIKMIREKYGLADVGLSFFLQPLTEIHLSENVPASDGLSDAGNPAYSYILSGIALFILIIACINFVNLMVARSIKRAKEIGIRKAIGGNRNQLIVQFLGESFLLCLAAFVLAILLVQVVLPVFNQLSGKALALSYLVDFKLIAGYIILFISTVLLAGFYPALIISDYNPVRALNARFTLNGKNYLQKSLVVLQFGLASFLIISTFVIFSQFDFLTSEKLGYDDSDLITIEKWSTKHDQAALFKEQLMKNSNITGVAFKNNGYSGNTVKVNQDQKVNITYETIDASFIPLLKIPVLKGRNFSRSYPSDSTHSVLVNEAFVKQAGWKEPVGQEIAFFDTHEKYRVVGVVKDYHFKPLTEKIEPQLFTMNPGSDYGMFYIKIKPGSETSSLKYIAETFKNMFPLDSYSYGFKDQENLKSYEAEGKWKQILLFGAILTIFISCIGLLGLSVLSAETRTKEIGIRKVLGASVAGIVASLSRDFLKLVLIALLLAIPLAWLAANKWLENYPYRIALNGWLFAFSAMIVIMISLLTISFQSVKAALANPVNSLRSE